MLFMALGTFQGSARRPAVSLTRKDIAQGSRRDTSHGALPRDASRAFDENRIPEGRCPVEPGSPIGGQQGAKAFQHFEQLAWACASAQAALGLMDPQPARSPRLPGVHPHPSVFPKHETDDRGLGRAAEFQLQLESLLGRRQIMIGRTMRGGAGEA